MILDPGSVHMGIFGFLLKLLKPIYSPLNKLVKIFEGHHKTLTEDYSFPTLVSFAIIIIASRWEIFGFGLLSFCQNERFLSFLSLCIFEESVFIFQFWNDKMQF